MGTDQRVTELREEVSEQNEPVIKADFGCIVAFASHSLFLLEHPLLELCLGHLHLPHILGSL